MAAAPTCFHCLQPIPANINIQVMVAGTAQPMCCHGCEAVAATIEAHGLQDFYRYRDTSRPSQVALIPEALAQLEVYDDEALQQRFVKTEGTVKQITLSVDGMTCAACAWLIEREIMRLPGIKRVQVNATTERLLLEWYAPQVQLSEILAALQQIGYQAAPFQQDQAELQLQRKRRAYVKRLGVAGLATMQVMMVAVGLYVATEGDIESGMRWFLWWVSLAFATPVIWYSAQPFYQSAWRSIQAGQPNMDVPVSIALLGAYGASAYATLTNAGEVYFESVSMFTLFLLGGRYLELLAKQRAVQAAANLSKLLPAVVERQCGPQQWEQVLVQQLELGDIVRVHAGATIAVDGVLLGDAAVEVNESILTGESRPQLKSPGALLLAGSVNYQQPLTMQVTATQHHTVLADIVALQDQALATKPKLAQVADRLASKFVVRLLIVASATLLIWGFIDPAKALWVTLSVLVATCPCALALAAPTALTGAIHRLNRAGVLVRNADILDLSERVKWVLFDKTGTLTTGAFSVQNRRDHPSAAHAVTTHNQIIAGLEQQMAHPLALALQELSQQPHHFESRQQNLGAGIEGTDKTGARYRVGSLGFIKEWHPQFIPELTDANVFLASERQILSELEVADTVRDDAAQTVKQLQQQGFRVGILSGDSQARVGHVAEQLGIDHVWAACTPTQKLAQVRELQLEAAVLMVGDGMNDGPVLAQADCALTFAAASDLAKTAADAICLNERLSNVTLTLNTAKQCRRIMKQNMMWALVYNIGILPVAMAGFVTPYIAALGMSISSLIVLLNSLRLYRS